MVLTTNSAQSIKLAALATEEVIYVQRELTTLGLLTSAVDGIAGSDTHKAWAKFKRLIKAVDLDKVCTQDLEALYKLVTLYNDNNSALVITKSELEQVFLNSVANKQVEDLNECLAFNDITTPARIAHFLAQTGHESGGLRWLTELSSGEQYEGRSDLGNTKPGDGVRYKGSGALQLTGRYNFQQFSEYVKDPRVMEGCNYVAIHYPFSSAGWFWTTRNLNSLCDQGASVAAITKIVNGGDRGLEDRLKYYERAKTVLTNRQLEVLSALNSVRLSPL